MSLHFWGTHMPGWVSEAWRFERLTALTRLPSRGIKETVALAGKVHIGAVLTWSEHEFARFAFDLVVLLQGTYEAGRVSSFYGMGSSFMELMRDVGAKPKR